MDLQLDGRRAFVSGSTRGIGYAIARALLAERATVVINGRTGPAVQDAVDRLRREVPGATVCGAAADLADPARAKELVEGLGEVDILVNNVGRFDLSSFQETPDEEWQRYFDLNVMSGVRLSRHVLGGMLERNRGRILFISSESGVDVPADMVPYGVTKAAMLALANGLAKLTRGTEITVNTILGGPTYSDGVAQTVEQLARSRGMAAEDLKAALAGGNRTSLLQRFIEPDEIASLALYLASPLSSATNGAAVRADGGVLTTTT
ncbi:SDR family NAD(P)-dependent oxidoreductase [Cellulomonas sp. PhB143]|uniref:SDR family NAD(P)-dependent oxidoreductase n=1 Tax=Cellulomonas sp. PhB143 TaxID=2485186 RepID=UPI000F49CAC1|nr:SDR family oxidoreductase [Cellulomonas sp. PhB143]ROS75478.1 NAD(P)-dependent dehydrogenase (short-subunit alcohol dehydrogenase family) [Cellulomonas sp. PhB143]